MRSATDSAAQPEGLNETRLNVGEAGDCGTVRTAYPTKADAIASARRLGRLPRIRDHRISLRRPWLVHGLIPTDAPR